MKKTLLVLAAALLGTAAVAQTSVLYSEDFESVSVNNYGIGGVPNGWTTIADNQTNVTEGGNNYGVFGQSWCTYAGLLQGSKVAFSFSRTNQGQKLSRWLISPEITVTDSGYSLLFDLIASAGEEIIDVLVSTTGVEKEDFTDTLLHRENPANAVVQTFAKLDKYKDSTIHIAFVNAGTDNRGTWLAIDNVQVLQLPTVSIAYAGAMVAPYVEVGQPFKVKYAVYNNSTEVLDSCVVTYQVGSQPAVSDTLRNMNVAPFDYYLDSITATYTNLESIVITFEVSYPNGQTDPDATDNTGSVETMVYDPSSIVPRKVLLEHFTTAQCVWCPYGHQRLHSAIDGTLDPDVVWVSHHIGYGTDAMTLSQSNQIGNYFTLQGAPMMMIDRNATYSTEPDAIGNIGEVAEIKQQLQNALAAPSYTTISVSNLQYDQETRVVSGTISGTFQLANQNNPHLTIWITEDSIIGVQADAYLGTQTDYQHDHVLRGLVTDIWGTAQGIDATQNGNQYTYDFSYTLPAKWRANKCRVVAFVNDYGSTATRRTVWNATKTDYLLDAATDPTATASIATAQAEISIVAYPNPAVEVAYISAESTIRSYSVVNSVGQVVTSQTNVNADVVELDVAGFAQGVYYITVGTDHGQATERLSVVR